MTLSRWILSCTLLGSMLWICYGVTRDGEEVTGRSVTTVTDGHPPRKSVPREEPAGISDSVSADSLTETRIPVSDSIADECIDINAATQTELETLPGIGPVIAGRIITMRREDPFTGMDDLLAVKGIGPARLDAVRNLICVGTPE